MALKDAPVSCILGMVIYIFGVLLYSIGFSTNYWYFVNDDHMTRFTYGLFLKCKSSVTGDSDCEYLSTSFMLDWQILGLILACIGLPLLLLGGVAAFYSLSHNSFFKLLIGAVSVAAGGYLGIVGVVVILVEAEVSYTENYISVGGSAIVFLTGCCFAVASAALQTIGNYISFR